MDVDPVALTLVRAWEVLERLEIPMAVVGGIALAAWSHPRFTQDVDLLLALPNKHIRAAVRYAEDHGWTLRKAGARAHIWGRLYCPQRDRDGCAKAVYSTPQDPQDHAKDIRRAVDRCPHQP